MRQTKIPESKIDIYLANALQNRNSGAEVSNMKDREFQVYVSIMTNAVC